MLPLRTKRPKAEAIGVLRTSPAPWKGLNTRDPVSAMPKGFATTLQNWWPAGYRVETRKGCANYFTGFASPIRSLCRWTGVGGTSKLFAVTSAGAYDVTAGGSSPPAVSQSLTNGRVQHVNFRTSAGTYLILVNGTDSLARYNGSAWAQDASYTITGGGSLTTADVVNLGVHRRRLWLVKEASTDAYYFNVDSITGDVTLFPLGGLFSEGGHLVAIGTWSRDGGDGPEDYCVFVSSKGQVAIYSGADPTSEATFSLVGVFLIPDPIGLKCLHRLGPDLLILTKGGAFSASSIMKGEGELGELALSANIAPSVSEAAASYGANPGWQFASLQAEKLLLINVPTAANSTAFQFAQNILTGAWCTFSGWDALCWEEMDGYLYFGMTTKVARGWVGYTDFGSSITSIGRDRFWDFGTGANKHWKLYKPVLSFSGTASISLGLDVDYKVSSTFSSGSTHVGSGSVWSGDIWNSAVWGAAEAPIISWLTPQAWPGQVAAVRLRAITTSGKVAWSSTDFILEKAGDL